MEVAILDLKRDYMGMGEKKVHLFQRKCIFE